MSLAELALHPFHRARSVVEALELMAARAEKGEATVPLAGGTDWVVGQHLAAAHEEELPLVLDLSGLDELTGIVHDDASVTIGAATSYLALRRDEWLRQRVPLLTDMAATVGAVQIQSRGTLGGNLATGSPAADGVAALAALDAEVLLASVRGTRPVPMASFYAGYKKTMMAKDELIVALHFTAPSEGAHQYFRKVGTRRAQAISKVALAALLERDGDRVTRAGFGMASVAPTVALLPEVRALAKKTPLAAITREALDAATLAGISPIDDVRSTAVYRRHVACVLVREAVRGAGADL